ncbi:MAG: hypothetical protein UH625_11535 [Muribaculaceae bacterium]|nr:hypothetical protein [Muribaculaceae bacterium]
MNKIIASFLLLAGAASACISAHGEIPVSKVERYSPTDMVFLDMATDAAKENKSRGLSPQGAILTMNGEFRSSGRATGDVSAEMTAFKKSRLNSLAGVTVYTVNEPDTKTYIFLCEKGAEKIYFVNDRASVIKAGLAAAGDYDDTLIPESVKMVPMFQIEFPDAAALLK